MEMAQAAVSEAAYRRCEMLAKRHKLMADWQTFCDGK
jgi:hypothetical protein